MKNWYIIQSHSSFENKVASQIREEAEKSKILDKIEDIIVPTHDITEVKRGKRVQRKKKYFPGYILIKSEMAITLSPSTLIGFFGSAWVCLGGVFVFIVGFLFASPALTPII